MLRLGVLVAGLCGLAGPSAGADTPTGDLATLQGNWKPLSIEFEGKPQATAEQMKQMTSVFDNAEYHLYFVDKGTDNQPKVLKLAVMTVTLDPTTTPKSITFEFAQGPLKGQKRHGIYQVTGNELKLCYGPAEKPKPTKFEAPANSGLFLDVWARQAK